MSSSSSEDASSTVQRKYAVQAFGGHGIVNQIVVVTADSAEGAMATFEDEFQGFEVGITTLPYDGETWETVFSRTEEAAVKIGTGRKGEYSDVPREVELLDMEVTAADAKPLEECDTWEADRAEDDHRIEQIVNDSLQQEGSA